MKLYYTVGLPASGKTTLARRMVKDSSPRTSTRPLIRVNRDDLRRSMFDVAFDPEVEDHVSIVQEAMIRGAFAAGYDVISDDTNLNFDAVARLIGIANDHGAEAEPLHMEVDLEECIRRDRGRPNYVGEQVIRRMYKKYMLPKVTHPIPKLNDRGLPKAILCDLDGTLSIHQGRSPYDDNGDLIHTDAVNPVVLHTLHSMQKAGYTIVFLSGRKESSRQNTRDWLREHCDDSAAFQPGEFCLLMRANDDHRDDTIVKRELYLTYVEPRYDVLFVLDDRQRVVDMWRELGLVCYQVAPGDF